MFVTRSDKSVKLFKAIAEPKGDDMEQMDIMNLVVQARNGDEKAKEAVIKLCRKYVLMQAKKFYYNISYIQMTIDDLISEGNIGVLHAITRYDESKGIDFRRYAEYWIRQVMERAIGNLGSEIRMPIHVVDAKRKLQKYVMEYYVANHSYPSLEKIVDATGLTENQILDIQKNASPHMKSLDTPLIDDTESTYFDVVADHNAKMPEQCFLQKEKREIIREAINQLPESDKKVVLLHFGVGKNRGRSLEEVAHEMDLSRQRIQQIEAQALKKLEIKLLKLGFTA